MADNPYTQTFEMQRAMIESGRTAVEAGASMTRTTTSALLDSTETTKSAQKSGVEFSRRAAHAMLDAFEQAGAGGGVAEARRTLDEQYDAFDEFHDDAWAAFEDATGEYEQTVEELTEAQREAFLDAVDAALAASDDAEEAVEETMEQVEVDVAGE
jgi:hypothetical protein